MIRVSIRKSVHPRVRRWLAVLASLMVSGSLLAVALTLLLPSGDRGNPMSLGDQLLLAGIALLAYVITRPPCRAQFASGCAIAAVALLAALVHVNVARVLGAISTIVLVGWAMLGALVDAWKVDRR
jgi:hypothetical protein